MTLEPDASPFPGHIYPQVLPIVARREPGGPAPWAHRHGEDWSTLTLRDIELKLRASRIDIDGEMPVINDELEFFEQQDAVLRRSAVLVCLFEDEGGVHVILTRRSVHLRNHRQEVAFPGGRSDDDETPVATALREAHEEVGLDANRLRVLGALTPIVTMASQSAIWPIVAFHDGRPRFEIDEREVDRVFTVSLAELLTVEAFALERWWRESRRPSSQDGSFPIYFYKVPGDLVWGATARILTELLSFITTDESSRE